MKDLAIKVTVLLDLYYKAPKMLYKLVLLRNIKYFVQGTFVKAFSHNFLLV